MTLVSRTQTLPVLPLAAPAAPPLAAPTAPPLAAPTAPPLAAPTAPAVDRREIALKFLVPEVVFGVGTIGEVGDAVRRMGGSRALVVTDEGVLAAGWADRAVHHLHAAAVDLRVWHGVTPNPKDHEVEAGLEAFLESGCDIVVAVGGGSCIDAAKAVAILSGGGGRIADYAGIDRVRAPVPPLVMAPSTAGSGADVSQFCVITDTTRRLKMTIADRAVVPNISVVDPTLLTTMSPELTAYTGIDALSHAVEAYVSLAANFLSDGYALAAVRAIAEHLPAAVERPTLEARVALARASLQAGLAFGNALLGATHAISHQIGGYLDLPQGLLNAILLPHVIRFNALSCPDRYVPVAAAMGVPAEHCRPDEVGDALAERVRLLADLVGVPSGLGSLGVCEQDLPRFAQQALSDAYITTNPRPVSGPDLESICRAAL